VALACAAPERVAKLVIVGPTGCLYSPFTPPPVEGTKAVLRYRQEPARERMRDIVDFLLNDPALRTEEFIDARHKAALEEQATVGEAFAPPDLTPAATQVRAPTLIAWGREDRFSPLDYGLNLTARIKDSQFHMFPRCGHWPQFEKADEFNHLVLDFLIFED
jgi:pimeloyl-ACP methyl ester carboxylesterase